MMILKPVAAAALTRSQVEKFDLMQPSNKMLGNTARDYPYFEEVPDSQIISWLGSSLVKAASSNDRRGAGSIRKLKYKRVRATNIPSPLQYMRGSILYMQIIEAIEVQNRIHI